MEKIQKGEKGEKGEKTRFICCSIFRAEIKQLQKEKRLTINDIYYLDSMLHIYPQRLEKELNIAIAEDSSDPIVLIFGDCHGNMCQYEKNPQTNIKRIQRINCIETILGQKRYRELRKEGAFFLLPEWTRRWKEIFEHELGLNHENARSLMQEQHKKLIYIDTGIAPIPTKELNEIANFTELKYEIIPTPLDHLLQAIKETREKNSSENERE